MQDPVHLSRRAAMIAPTALLIGAAGCAEAHTAAAPRASGASTLVAYVTRSGNTRVIAGSIARALEADIAEIRTAEPYPDDYEAHVEQARRERDAGTEPALAPGAPDPAAYQTIYLGFPIWGGTAPPPIRSWLRANDLTGKDVRPFITHGGYGAGSGLDVVRSYAPNARIAEAFVLEADQERRTLTETMRWVEAGKQETTR
jgi:flavodoxin